MDQHDYYVRSPKESVSPLYGLSELTFATPACGNTWKLAWKEAIAKTDFPLQGEKFPTFQECS